MAHPVEHHPLDKLLGGIDYQSLLLLVEFEGLHKFGDVNGGVDELKVGAQFLVLGSILLKKFKQFEIASGQLDDFLSFLDNHWDFVRDLN